VGHVAQSRQQRDQTGVHGLDTIEVLQAPRFDGGGAGRFQRAQDLDTSRETARCVPDRVSLLLHTDFAAIAAVVVEGYTLDDAVLAQPATFHAALAANRLGTMFADHVRRREPQHALRARAPIAD